MEGRESDKGGRLETDEGEGNVEEAEGGRREVLELGTLLDKDINEAFEHAEDEKGGKEEGREEEKDGGRKEREGAGRDEETESERGGKEGRIWST